MTTVVLINVILVLTNVIITGGGLGLILKMYTEINKGKAHDERVATNANMITDKPPVWTSETKPTK
jgi:hypothetical protein